MTALATRTQRLLPLLRNSSRKTKAAIAAVVTGTMSTAALAFTAPAAGQLGFDIYNIVVNNLLLGPIGIMGAVLALVFGGFSAIQGRYLSAVMGIVAGAVLFSADSVVQSLGFLV